VKSELFGQKGSTKPNGTFLSGCIYIFAHFVELLLKVKALEPLESGRFNHLVDEVI
jgi:hypothetical protein